MLVTFNPSSHTGSTAVTVGSHQVDGTTVSQGGQTSVTLTTAGLTEYNNNRQAIARGDFVVIGD